MAKRWYVVQAKSNQETIAVQQLRNQKFNVFFPTYLHKVKSKKTEEVITRALPLFPSYVFIQFDIRRHPRWRSVNGTRGVIGLVGCTEEYVSPLPRGCLEEVIKRSDEKGHVTLEAAVGQVIEFTEGMRLSIRGEQYNGLVATYCSHSEKRVWLMLTLLNRKIRLILPIDAVQPL